MLTSIVLSLLLSTTATAAPAPTSYGQAWADAAETGAYGIKQVKGGWTPTTAEEDSAADAEAQADAMLAPVLAMLSR
jgi:hypothetical protein